MMPIGADVRIIGYYLGRIVLVVAAASLLPMIWAVAGRECHPFA